MPEPLSRREVLLSAAASVLSCGVRVVPAAGQPRGPLPNILFILADDLGYADLSCYGRQDYRTPVLDELASQGVKFSNAYANSAVCSASRTALITGRYQYRLPVGLFEPGIGGANYGLPEGHPTLPSLLRQQGYRTSLFGKWHLGDTPQYRPIHRGYDHFFGFLGGASDYFQFDRPMVVPGARAGAGAGASSAQPPLCPPPAGAGFAAASASSAARPALDSGGDTPSQGLYEDDHHVRVSGYLTDLLADRASDEIARCAAGRQPFFISLHFNAPHWPWEGPHDQAASRLVTDLRDMDQGSMRKYGEMVVALDTAIGRVLQRLRESGLARETLVIFTSDNGGERFSNDWPFIGAKGELLEGGLRIPLIVRWPARVAAGGHCDQVLIHMDWLPTLLAAAGGTPDPRYPSDGLNLLPVLLGQRRGVSRTLFWRYHAADQQAMREGDWKYLRIGGREYLFNLVEDERERANRRLAEPERFARMRSAWADWNATMLPYPPHLLSDNPKLTGCWADRY